MEDVSIEDAILDEKDREGGTGTTEYWMDIIWSKVCWRKLQIITF